MGGFMINGCGAADSYKKIKGLGQGYCKNCGKERTFGLYELNRKVRVAWIPTVTLSTKCAVICEKCKCGSYVEGALLDAILKDKAVCEFGKSGIKIALEKRDASSAADGSAADSGQYVWPSGAARPPVAPAPAPAFAGQPTDQPAAPAAVFAGQPTDQPVAPTPAFAGQPSDQPVAPAAAFPGQSSDFQFVRKKKVCPLCGLSYAYKRVTCDICGGPLQEG